jgi:uncharacterized DUF497 family protein
MKKGFDFQVSQFESGGVVFEFDPVKSRSNLIKHGIDFVEAQCLWQGPVAVIKSAVSEELRWVVVGRVNKTTWSAVITFRNEKIRIISVRRSRKNEEKIWRDHYQSGRKKDYQPGGV